MGTAPSPKEVSRRQVASVAGKKPSVSVSLLSEGNNRELAHAVTCVAMSFWVQALRTKTDLGSHLMVVKLEDPWERFPAK